MAAKDAAALAKKTLMKVNGTLDQFVLMPYWSRAAVGVKVTSTGKQVAGCTEVYLGSTEFLRDVACTWLVVSRPKVNYFAAKGVPILKAIEFAGACVPCLLCAHCSVGRLD